MLFVTDSIQPVQGIHYQGSSRRFEDFKTEGQVIHTVKSAGDLVLLAKEEMVLQVMIDKIN